MQHSEGNHNINVTVSLESSGSESHEAPNTDSRVLSESGSGMILSSGESTQCNNRDSVVIQNVNSLVLHVHHHHNHPSKRARLNFSSRGEVLSINGHAPMVSILSMSSVVEVISDSESEGNQ